MTRKDFKIIAEAIKQLVEKLKKAYGNFDQDKFQEHIFKDEQIKHNHSALKSLKQNLAWRKKEQNAQKKDL